MKKVHVTDSAGEPIYNRLLEEKNLCKFAFGRGFVYKSLIVSKGYKIVDGWIPRDQWNRRNG